MPPYVIYFHIFILKQIHDRHNDKTRIWPTTPAFQTKWGSEVPPATNPPIIISNLILSVSEFYPIVYSSMCIIYFCKISTIHPFLLIFQVLWPLISPFSLGPSGQARKNEWRLRRRRRSKRCRCRAVRRVCCERSSWSTVGGGRITRKFPGEGGE